MQHVGGDLIDAVPKAAAGLLGQLRARSLRIHCITNTVAQAYTANILLAAGCGPSMTVSAEEIGGFVARAEALLVNLGTFDAERREATGVAIASAHEHRRPWVLDPVFVDRSASRAAFASDLVARSAPRVVRLNHAELAALVDGGDPRQAAISYARATGVIVAVSGAADLVTDGTRTVIADGSTAQIFYPSLIGSDIVYTALDGAGGDLYSVPASATTPSGTRVGTQTCGSTTAQWASAWSGGWICGRVFGLDAVDATGANKTSFYDTKPTDSFYNPSPIDGTTFYAFGDGTGSANPVRPLLKMDTQTPNAGTSVLCLDGGAKWNARISTTDLIWEEADSSGSVRTLRRIAR